MTYLGIAYLIVWAVIALYLWSLARRQARLEQRLSRLGGGPDEPGEPRS